MIEGSMGMDSIKKRRRRRGGAPPSRSIFGISLSPGTVIALTVLCLFAAFRASSKLASSTVQNDAVGTISSQDAKTGEGAGLDNGVSRRSTEELPSKQWMGFGGRKERAGDASGTAEEDTNSDLGDKVMSRAIVQAAASGTGLMNKYYYRFQNVQLTRDKLTVYYGPGFVPPTEPLWIDMITCNASKPFLPTMLVLKGDLHTQKWFHVPIEYVPAAQHQPKCTTWVDKPTYLLQVRYAYNIWHTWNEGLMAIFQTFRELGYLPLASIDAEGNMEEILDGMGEGCAYEFDPKLNRTVQPSECEPRQGLLPKQRCDPATESWCRKGAVVSALRDEGGPVILPFTAASVVNVWSHLYNAMSSDVRDWSTLEGACFKNLIIGKSPTLNFYQILNNTEPEQSVLELYPHIDQRIARVEAMAVFKAFVTSAQREWVDTEAKKDPTKQKWAGYRNPNMERLRRGVGPEDAHDDALLSSINPREVPGMLREELDELKELGTKRIAAMQPGKERYMAHFGGAAEAHQRETDEQIDLHEDYDDDYEAMAAQTRKHKSAQHGSGGRKNNAEIGAKQHTTDNSNVHIVRSHSMRESSNSNDARLNGSRRALQQSASGQRRRWFDHNAVYQFERPRPVVTYMSRNFFSRGVLNERDILDYILAHYNVTLRVTTFEEPLLEVMDLLGSTDVMFGMHGAGWTNGLFVKRGATTQQLFPFGWRLPDNSTVRGYNYREIVLASQCKYSEWVNPYRQLAFFRRIDYKKQSDLTYSLHPDPSWPMPEDSWPGNPWIYQNTYVDMEHFGPYIDEMMAEAGIKRMAAGTSTT